MNQAEVLDFLTDPATHGGAPVHRIETHISVLFLAGEKAWKLKKAVTLPFLDFASLEQRHAACLTEIEVNRVAAGELYLGVVPVTRDDAGNLRLGGDESLRLGGDESLRLACAWAATKACAWAATKACAWAATKACAWAATGRWWNGWWKCAGSSRKTCCRLCWMPARWTAA
ncbi:MAG: hypothetical protein HYU59_03735 [Magnetospirillum gryphiswaldense]|nr:hypothetical protein [Magnetospirillum gryphiswaldense]